MSDKSNSRFWKCGGHVCISRVSNILHLSELNQQHSKSQETPSLPSLLLQANWMQIIHVRINFKNGFLKKELIFPHLIDFAFTFLSASSS